jgi:hypothetical protein
MLVGVCGCWCRRVRGLCGLCQRYTPPVTVKHLGVRSLPLLAGQRLKSCLWVSVAAGAGVSGGFVDCASADGMSNAKWRRRFDWSKQLDSLNKQYFGNHSYRWEQASLGSGSVWLRAPMHGPSWRKCFYLGRQCHPRHDQAGMCVIWVDNVALVVSKQVYAYPPPRCSMLPAQVQCSLTFLRWRR